MQSMSILTNDPTLGWFSVGLILLVSITGAFNIYSTAETSAMTRNLWKNTRAILVWIIGIIAWYASDGDPNMNTIGESLHPLYSPLQAIGFGVMCLGIYVYYTDNSGSITEKLMHCKKFKWWSANKMSSPKDTKEEVLEPTEHTDHSEEHVESICEA